MKGKNRLFITFMLLTLLAGAVSSMSSKDEIKNLPKGEITVSGRVRLVGTAAFSDLVITDKDENDWYVEKEDRQLLARMEQRTVTVKGTTEYQELTLYNGKKAGIRRFLRKITLVN
jgi:hypothetical protein